MKKVTVMKKTLGTFYERIADKSDSKRFLDSAIEMVSDDAAQQVRGGDKDYTPLYEIEPSMHARWFLPSILLES
ncbi:MAG: hypothetical protein MUF58_02355 [Arcicella sp.]|nr:hypothetical protein [Arcicella sp.]